MLVICEMHLLRKGECIVKRERGRERWREGELREREGEREMEGGRETLRER